MGALTVKVHGDGSGFQATLDKLTQQAGAFGKNLNAQMSGNFSEAVMGVVPGLTAAVAGVFSVDAIKESLKSFAELGEKIKFGSAKLNIDTDSFQQIDRVMKEIGEGGAESLQPIVDKVAEAILHIHEGRSDATELLKSFAGLGVAGADMNKPVIEIVEQIADMNAGIKMSTDQMGQLRQVAGKSADVLREVAEIGGFNSDFAKSGIVSEEDLATVEQFNQKMRFLDQVTAGFFNHVKAFALDGNWARALPILGMDNFVKLLRAGTEANEEKEKQKAEAQAKLLAATRARDMALAESQGQAEAMQKHFNTDAKKAAAIDREIDALKERNRLAAMTPEEKRLELLKQIASMNAELNFGGSNTASQDAAMRKKIEEDRGEIARIDREAEKKKPIHHNIERLGNSAIGGIMLSHGGDDWKKHAAETAKHVASIDKKTHPARPDAANRDYH